MAMMTPEQAKKVKDIAIIEGFKPYLDTEVDNLLRALDNKVYMEIEQGSLTAEKALSYWMERNSYRKLQQKFDKRTRVGQVIAQSNPDALAIPMNSTYNQA